MKEASEQYAQAAELIRAADGILITAGAGIGVDSGMPDFRSGNGFWRTYPALGKQNIRFEEIATADNFNTQPELVWGFYGHRLNMYRKINPHRGFRALLDLAKHVDKDYFVFTSNVDGHFERAGFDPMKIAECHGSIHYMMCQHNCSRKLWSADDFVPVVDEERCMLINDLPRCPDCGALARPNILMFNDWVWWNGREDEQRKRLRSWLNERSNVVAIEIGAGRAIPTVRWFSEENSKSLIRINPQDYQVSRPQDISIEATALDGIDILTKIFE
jgi:NAD-dependent SIR2 family protein deacetylase